MCGIAGILSPRQRPVRFDEVHAMCNAMVHRGPNSDGFYVGPEVGLGMRRLSIIDLQTGDQPIRNEDGTVWAVLNGEIYNYRELRRHLEDRGHVFYTSTDTETIVHLYEEYGARCVDHMRGMFAFAVWDEKAHRLLVARDRVGIKPLYYAWTGERLVFGSELKTVLASPDVERRIDPSSLAYLLTFLYTPRTDSIVAGVKKLPPAHLIVAEPGREPRLERYWDVHFAPDTGKSIDALVDEIRGTLEDSVRLHMVSDVPVGAFLSGGIDSSSVVATMSKLTTQPVKTFSIGFPEREYDELTWARQVAKRFGTEHRELIVEPADLQVLEELAWYLDEPFGDSSAIPTWFVSKLAAQEVTVVLSGDGGDELFSGYDRYLVESRERAWRFVPDGARKLMGAVASALPPGVKGRNFLRHHSLPSQHRYFDALTLFGGDERRRLLSADLLHAVGGADPWRDTEPYFAGPHWLSALQYLDIHTYLPLDILTKVDRMSMAHSIEARVPLLDHKLVELAARLPPEHQLKDGTTKYLFRRALRGLLPDAIIDRPKRGFAIPLGRWFKGELSSFVRDVLTSQRSRERGLFNPAYVETLLHPSYRHYDFDAQLWTLLSIELWCRTFIDRDRSVPVVPEIQASSPRLHAGAA
jgi:asparagine synthase (glutamine-hydrolysing)